MLFLNQFNCNHLLKVYIIYIMRQLYIVLFRLIKIVKASRWPSSCWCDLVERSRLSCFSLALISWLINMSKNAQRGKLGQKKGKAVFRAFP